MGYYAVAVTGLFSQIKYTQKLWAFICPAVEMQPSFKYHNTLGISKRASKYVIKYLVER